MFVCVTNLVYTSRLQIFPLSAH